MINADSEKRRKTLIRVHLSTAPEAKWSLVIEESSGTRFMGRREYYSTRVLLEYLVQILVIYDYRPGVGKMIPFTIPGFQTPCGTILGTVNEP